MKTAFEILRQTIGEHDYAFFSGREKGLFEKTLFAMKKYAEIKCEEQRVKVGNELNTWTEDLSIPNQNKIHELCQGVDASEFN